MSGPSLSHLQRRHDWKAQQTQAAFHQGLLSSVQQGATTAYTMATILLTLGAVMVHLSGLRPGQDVAVLGIAVASWMLLVIAFTFSNGRSAARIRNGYLAEQARLFPRVRPYRLESFLLDFHDGLPRPLRRGRR